MKHEKGIDEIAKDLYFIAHIGITQTIDFIEKACKIIDKGRSSFSKGERSEIGLEVLLFFIHITDRMAITILGEERTWELMEKQKSILLSHMMGTVGNISQEAKEKFELSLALRFHERQQEYGNYRFIGEEGEGPKNTLCWEFGKRISVLAGYPMDIRLVMTAYSIAEPFIKAIDQWLKENLKEF